MAQGNLKKFRTYREEPVQKRDDRLRSNNVMVVDDDEDHDLDIPARFAQKWTR